MQLNEKDGNFIIVMIVFLGEGGFSLFYLYVRGQASVISVNKMKLMKRE